MLGNILCVCLCACECALKHAFLAVYVCVYMCGHVCLLHSQPIRACVCVIPSRVATITAITIQIL